MNYYIKSCHIFEVFFDLCVHTVIQLFCIIVRCDSIDYYDDMGHVEDDYYGTNDDIAYDDDYAEDGDVYDPHDDEDYGNNNKYDVDENIMLRPRSPLGII